MKYLKYLTIKKNYLLQKQKKSARGNPSTSSGRARENKKYYKYLMSLDRIRIIITHQRKRDVNRIK